MLRCDVAFWSCLFSCSSDFVAMSSWLYLMEFQKSVLLFGQLPKQTEFGWSHLHLSFKYGMYRCPLLPLLLLLLLLLLKLLLLVQQPPPIPHPPAAFCCKKISKVRTSVYFLYKVTV